MYYSKTSSGPTAKDLPKLLQDIPVENIDFVKSMASRMMSHPAYGKG